MPRYGDDGHMSRRWRTLRQYDRIVTRHSRRRWRVFYDQRCTPAYAVGDSAGVTRWRR